MYDDRYERHRERAERKLARRAAKMGIPSEPTPPLDSLSGAELDAAIRKRVEARMRARRAFMASVVSFLSVNLLLWFIYAVTDLGGYPWPIWVTVPWGIATIIQAVYTFQNTGAALDRREDNIRREVEMEKMRLGLASDPYNKPKRDQSVHLSEDGEMIADDDEQQAMKAKRG